MGTGTCRRSTWTWLLPIAVAASVSSSHALDLRLPNKTDSLKFAVIGDYGTGERPSHDIAAQMAALRARFPFELVFAEDRPTAPRRFEHVFRYPVVSLTASAGFTFALFFATSIMPPGPLLSELKLGALSTVAGAFVALVAARLLHVGRFSRC